MSVTRFPKKVLTSLRLSVTVRQLADALSNLQLSKMNLETAALLCFRATVQTASSVCCRLSTVGAWRCDEANRSESRQRSFFGHSLKSPSLFAGLALPQFATT
mmetsp:Transcript_7091/g.20899  ORF Transcript_7091/g.20899 Transcript_7091/m.20899 type:complete len:103 (-) Transcript_7091:179-487(-)